MGVKFYPTTTTKPTGWKAGLLKVAEKEHVAGRGKRGYQAGKKTFYRRQKEQSETDINEDQNND